MQRLKTILIYGAATGFASMISFMTTTVLTRFTTTEIFGRYALLLSTSMIISAVVSEWMKQSISRMLPGADEEQTSAIVGAAVSFISVLFASSILAIVISFVVDGSEPVVASILFVTGQAVFGVCSGILQAGALARVLGCSMVTCSAGKLSGGVIALTVFCTAANGLLVGTASGIWFACSIMISAIMRHWKINWKDTARIREVLRQMGRYGTPFIFWFILSQLLNYGDRYIVRYFEGEAVVGLYSAGYSISSGLVLMLSMPLSMAMTPKLMETWNKGHHKRALNLSLYLSVITFCCCSTVVAGLALFSEHVAELFLGEHFKPAHHVMWVVALGVSLWHTSIFWHKVLEYTNRTWVMVFFLCIAALVNLGVDLMAVPTYGMVGAAWGTVAGYGTYALLNLASVAKALRSRVWQ